MIILKKLVRKLYHLILFLSVFFLFSPFAFATDGQTNGSIYSSDISASAQAQWYDVNRNSLTTTIIQEPRFSPYFRSPFRQTSYLSFNVYTNFQPDVLYSLTVYINTNTNSNVSSWNNVVSTGTYNGGANSNNQQGNCRVDIYSFVDTYNIKYKININEDGTNEALSGAYYITFSPSCGGSYINIPIAFGGSADYMYFYGYHLEVLGLTDGLTRSDVQSVINSSGLATASSVQDVKRGVNEVKQELSNIDSTLNNSSVDSSDSTINNLKNQIPTNSVISDLLLLPVRFLQNFVNALGSSCSQFNLGSLYGTNLYMPCINIENYLGSAIWTTIDLIISGLFIYALRKKFIEIYQNLTNLKNGGNEVD